MQKHQLKNNFTFIFTKKAALNLAAFFAFFVIFSCNKDDEYDKTKAISAFAIIDQVAVDSSLQNVAITIPAQKSSSEWTSSASNINQEIENFAFTPNATGKKFLSGSSEIWSGSRPYFFSDRFVFEPIIKNNKIYLLDARGVLNCYDLTTKKKIWAKRAFARRLLKLYQNPKIGYFEDKIFAIAGSNVVVALSADSGETLWSKTISSVPVSTPVSDGNMVFVTTNDNKTYALDIADGKLIWVASGINKTTAIFGAANPVIYKNLLLVSYSSGEIYALNKNTSEAVWSQDLNLNKAGNSDFYLNDVDATLIIKKDTIYAIGNGGLMMAINLKNGTYLWKKEIAGITNFWITDDFIYVVNNDDKLLALYKKTGAVKWVEQLPNYKNAKKPETKIIYSGVVMAGDKLLITDSRGKLLLASPFDGKIEQIFNIGGKIFHSPVVVNGKIYLHVLGSYTVNLAEIS